MPELSYETKRSLINGALNPGDEKNIWIRDLDDVRVIIDVNGEVFAVPYTIAPVKEGEDEPKVTLGDRTPVKVTYEEYAELKDVEILRAGTFTSATGEKVTFTEDDLIEIVSNSEKLGDTLRPPLVVSHAEGDKGTEITVNTVGSPVVGWVKSLRMSGKSVLATFSDVPEKALELIGATLKRLSPEVYKNFEDKGTSYGRALRRVCFVPISAIKSLADVTQAHLAYGEKTPDQHTWVIFNEEIPESKRKEEEKLDIEKLQEEMKKLSGKIDEQGEQVTKLQEENAALKTEKDEAAIKLAETEKVKEEAVTKLSETEKKQRAESIHAFCETLKKEGKLLPAWQDMGLGKFMENLSDDDADVVKFAEKSDDKLTPLGFMKKFLEALPDTVKFGEIAKSGEAVKTGGESEKEDAIEKYMETHKVKYRDAALAVSKDRPDLFPDE